MSEPRFIVSLPSGRKSKPVSRQQILDMAAEGKIPTDCTVNLHGTQTNYTLSEFLNMPESTAPQMQPHAAVSEAAPVVQARQQQWSRTVDTRSFDRMQDMFLSVLMWPFQGFNIPTRGVNSTRDYLRRNLAWIELLLRLNHVATLLILVIFAALFLREVLRLVQQPRANVDWGEVFWAAAGASHIYFWIFIILMINEAYMRIVPAAIRYWVEVTEEQRLKR